MDGRSMSLLLCGHGYLGARIAAMWQTDGQTVSVVTRSASKAEELQKRGLQTIIGDVTRGNLERLLPNAKTVVVAIGYDRGSQLPIEEVYPNAMRGALAALPEPPERIICISSTGVYGAAGGDWVDENSPCDPQRAGGKASLTAENLLRESKYGEQAMILRLAGIYGPGRIPRRHDLLAGKPIDAPQTGWLNLIHVEDAAQIVFALQNHRGPITLNISDGHPCERGDYYRELARLLSAPAPTFAQPSADSPAASRAGVSRRISNARLQSLLGYQFRYPNYTAGLHAIVAAEAP
jgi:nucleoside-diphosphate-sugar epimerase